MNQYRLRNGQWSTKKPLYLIVTFVVLGAIAFGLTHAYVMGSIEEYDASVEEVEATDQIDTVVDHYERALRGYLEAKEQFALASSTLDHAIDVYNQAVFNLSTISE